MNAPVLTRFIPAIVDGRRVTMSMPNSTYQAMISAVKKQRGEARRAWARLGKLGKVWKRRRRK